MKPHLHVWSIEGTQQVEIFESHSSAARPVTHETDVLYRCLKCGKPKVKTLKGTWSREQLR